MRPDLGEFLREKRLASGLKQREVAEKLGIQVRSYQHYEEGRNKPKSETITQLSELLKFKIIEVYEQTVPHETLETPIGPEVKESYFKSRQRSKNADNGPFMVPFVPVKAQAGYVKAIDQQMFIENMEKYAIPPGVNHRGAFWRYWEIEGDSMEPEFYSGDVILTSQVHEMDWEQLRNFYLYVIVTDERVLFKRIFCKNPLEWVLISANEGNYPQQLLPVEFIKEVWVFRRSIVSKAPPAKTYVITV